MPDAASHYPALKYINISALFLYHSLFRRSAAQYNRCQQFDSLSARSSLSTLLMLLPFPLAGRHTLRYPALHPDPETLQIFGVVTAFIHKTRGAD
ncbi:TPA: hypothetical protein MIH39_26970 [Klebsiella pneumoniae]|nr:hypothetical protein [Klebsiella pneumoniae]HBX8146455.1 hypothetical protein [Klebsiella pneumoniae]